MLGKKLYRTSMLNIFRLLVLGVVIFFINDFYLETISNDTFLQMLVLPASFLTKFKIFWTYVYQYPTDFVNLVVIVVIPAIYFAFIRGVRFHEKGFVFNKGVPFVDTSVLYQDVKSYKLLHPKLAIWISTKSGDSFIVADNNVERVIAILDQHNVPGELASDQYVKIVSNYRRFVYFCVMAFFIIFAIRKLGALLSNL
jgi:hypothetical protein